MALAATIFATVGSWRRPPRPPNVVVIVIDTLRADHLPMYGYERNTAPFLSALAARSVVFTAAESTSAWTAPATASLFTSLYPFQHGVVTGFMVAQSLQEEPETIALDRLPEEVATLPEIMKAAGYSTFGVTANINVGEAMGFARGFDRFRNYTQDDSAEVLAKRAKRWRLHMSAALPYFLYLHFMDPHAPYRQRPPWFAATAGTTDRDIAAYDSEIAYVDSVLKGLYAAMGWERDTVLVVTADHGEEFGDHQGEGHGKTLYSEMLHVPLLVHHADAFRARVVAEPVGLIDILPTLRELAHSPPDPRDEGLSLVPFLEGAPIDPARRALFAHLLRRDLGGRLLHSVRRGPWKYIESGSGESVLFDLSSDPEETRNAVGDSPEIARRLQTNLHDFVRTSRKVPGRAVLTVPDPETIERLRSLGYVR